jgi:hypothetical protein
VKLTQVQLACRCLSRGLGRGLPAWILTQLGVQLLEEIEGTE